MKITKSLVELIAQSVNAASNCIKSGNTEWEANHMETVNLLVRDFMPSGSGIDNGTKLSWEKSLKLKGEKLVFTMGYHHMDESGMYSGWTYHEVTVSSHLFLGLQIKISGPNRNDIKEYLGEVFNSALTQIIEYELPTQGQEFAGYHCVN